MAGLRLPNQPAPYYIAYTIHDTTRTNLTAFVGTLLGDTTGRSRRLHVEVRVGDYDFDSSRFITAGRAPRAVSVTLDDDYPSLRRRIWLATDAAYKRAVDVYARKTASFQNRVNTNPVPDFSRATPIERLASAPTPRLVGASWRDTVRQVSAIFGETADIDQTQVSLSVLQGTRYFLNSEGFKTIAPVELASLAVQAQTQAADGMVLRDRLRSVRKAGGRSAVEGRRHRSRTRVGGEPCRVAGRPGGRGLFRPGSARRSGRRSAAGPQSGAVVLEPAPPDPRQGRARGRTWPGRRTREGDPVSPASRFSSVARVVDGHRHPLVDQL